MYPASAAPKWCILQVGERSWRIAAADVLDLVAWPRITCVPLQPAADAVDLVGVFAWRGAMVPLFDIAKLAPEQRRQVVVVRVPVGNAQVPVGIAATQASLGDAADSADLLSVSELAAKLPSPR
jgi:chemotaxis signal transduction protein